MTVTHVQPHHPPHRRPSSRWWPVLVSAALLTLALLIRPLPVIDADEPHNVFLPVVQRPPQSWPPLNESYGTVGNISGRTSIPAAQHPDLNLALRGYAERTDLANPLRLVDYSGHTDYSAPQLAGLLGRAPDIRSVHRVYNWDRTGFETAWPVSVIGLASTAGEPVRLPHSGYHIGEGYNALVLYAAPERITLKYTRDDNVVSGYTIHVEQIAVEPALLNLYQQMNNAGRHRLPALRHGQAFGRASGSELHVVIRDCGTFMDPRSRKDWWQAY